MQNRQLNVVLGFDKQNPSELARKTGINDVGAEYVMNYSSNKLSSTKYTLWNFLPLSIIE